MDVIQQVTLTSSATGATLCKSEAFVEKFLISLVNVAEDSDIDIATDIELYSQLLPLLQNYTLQKSKDISVEMKILLPDEIPVCSSPRSATTSREKNC